MDNQKNSVKRNWKIIYYLSLLFMIVLIGQDLIREVVFFDRDLKQFEESLQENLQQSLKTDIQTKEEIIGYQMLSFEEDFQTHIKSNLSEIHNLIEEAVIYYSGDLNNDEHILDILSRYQENDSFHEYYLVNYDGDVLFNGVEGFSEDVNIYDLQDVFGRNYIANMILILENSHSGFINYYVQEEDKVFRYQAYFSSIEEKPYFLMTYGKETTYKDQIKDEIVEHIASYGQNSTGDIFMYEQQGVILQHVQEGFINNKVNELNDPYLFKTKRLIDFIVTADQPGFISYDFYEDGVGSEIIKKTAYVTYISELDLVIGSSIDSDYYDSFLSNFQDATYDRILTFKIPVYLILILIAFIIYKFIKDNIDKSLIMLKEEEELYTRFADLRDEIILITNEKGEIIFLNALGEKTINPTNSKKVITIDELLKEEESYYLMFTPNQTYYVQYIVDSIVYHGESAKLYLFRDITETVKSLKEIQNVSTQDDLTSLGNRRLMNMHFTEHITPVIRNGGQAFLAIIDLDFFKQVNDTYGHVYGDKVLRIISKIMQEEINDHLHIYRIGGDEFALFAWDISKNNLLKTIDRMNEKLKTYDYEKEIKLSFSAGVTAMDLTKGKVELSLYYYEADEKLYQAKNEGRSKVIS